MFQLQSLILHGQKQVAVLTRQAKIVYTQRLTQFGKYLGKDLRNVEKWFGVKMLKELFPSSLKNLILKNVLKY